MPTRRPPSARSIMLPYRRGCRYYGVAVTALGCATASWGSAKPVVVVTWRRPRRRGQPSLPCSKARTLRTHALPPTLEPWLGSRRQPEGSGEEEKEQQRRGELPGTPARERRGEAARPRAVASTITASKLARCQ